MQKIVARHLGAATDAKTQVAAEAMSTLKMAYEMIEQRLADRTWAAGNAFSIADCAAAPALFASIVAPFCETQPHLAAYFERLMERAPVKRALHEARPYFSFFPLKECIPPEIPQHRVAGGLK